MDTHCFAFAARRWIASALVAGVTLVGSLGFSSVASAAEPGVGAPHEQVERVARHHEHRHGERRGWGERHRGEHGRKHGGERRGHGEHRR